MLNIEHLRKQAKLYLRWHREHYYPVAARIRAVLPRFSRLTDRETLAQRFRLSDAQELVARTVGFESWEALRRGSHFVTHARTGTLAMTTLVAAEPVARGFDHAGGCKAALSRISKGGRRVCSSATVRTVGRTNIHRA